MPRGDRTGPDGMGSMTGRGMGFCSGNERPGYTNTGFGRGRGFGRGFRGRSFGSRRGFGRGFGPGQGFGFRSVPYYENRPMTKEEEKQMLKEEAKNIEQEQKDLIEELNSIKKRLSEMKK